MIKMLNYLEIEENFSLIKGICQKPTVKSILNDGRLSAFSLRSGTRQGFLL